MEAIGHGWRGEVSFICICICILRHWRIWLCVCLCVCLCVPLSLRASVSDGLKRRVCASKVY